MKEKNKNLIKIILEFIILIIGFRLAMFTLITCMLFWFDLATQPQFSEIVLPAIKVIPYFAYGFVILVICVYVRFFLRFWDYKKK